MKPAFRNCLLSGKQLPERRLIRLVLAPNNTLVPDINSELEGKDAWLECRRSVVNDAVTQKTLSQHFGLEPENIENLPDLVGGVLRKRTLSFLGLARRNGSLISGFAKVTSALQGGTATLLLLPADNKYEGKDDVTTLSEDVEIVDLFSLSELQSALSNGNSMHVVLKGKAIAAQCKEELTRLLTYEERIKPDDE